MNAFEELVSSNWDKKWDMAKLSRHPQITTRFVDAYPDKDWFYGADGLSCNINVTPSYVEEHMDKNWDWGYGGLSSNPSITAQFIQDHINERWDWRSLSSLILQNEIEVINVPFSPSVTVSSNSFTQIATIRYSCIRLGYIYRAIFKAWSSNDTTSFDIRLYNVTSATNLITTSSSNTDQNTSVFSGVISNPPLSDFILSIDAKITNGTGNVMIGSIIITSIYR